MLFSKLLLFFVVISAFLLNPAHSSDEENSQGNDDEMDDILTDISLSDLLNITITTASKQAESIQDAPGTIYVVTKRQIRERGYVNTGCTQRSAWR